MDTVNKVVKTWGGLELGGGGNRRKRGETSVALSTIKYFYFT